MNKFKIEIPINYSDVYRQTGVKKGNIAKRLGQWSVDNCPNASIAVFNPPYEIGDKTSFGIIKDVTIHNDCWQVIFTKFPVKKGCE